MSRVCAPLLALFVALFPAAPSSGSYRSEPAASPAFAACPPLAQQPASIHIAAPADDTVVSQTIPLAVVPPADTTDRVQVCADYLYGSAGALAQERNMPVGTLDPADSWSASWDVSSLPGQRGITLAFIAHDPSGAQTLIGTVQGLVVDHMPPSATATIPGNRFYTAPDGTLYVAASTPISPTASDPLLDDGSPGSGATTYAGIDTGPLQAVSEPVTFGPRGDGRHTLTYTAVDAAGNSDILHPLAATLDTAAPSVTPLITGTFGPDGSSSGPVTVSFSAADSGSGVATMSYAVEPGFGQTYTPGQQITFATSARVDYAATDRVGNTFIGTLPITITTPAPTPTATATATPTHTPDANTYADADTYAHGDTHADARPYRDADADAASHTGMAGDRRPALPAPQSARASDKSCERTLSSRPPACLSHPHAHCPTRPLPG